DRTGTSPPPPPPPRRSARRALSPCSSARAHIPRARRPTAASAAVPLPHVVVAAGEENVRIHRVAWWHSLHCRLLVFACSWLLENAFGRDLVAGAILQVVTAVTAEDFRGLGCARTCFDRDDGAAGVEFLLVEARFLFADAQPGHGAEDSPDRGPRD